MTDYPQYPIDPSGQSNAAPAAAPRPRSVDLAVNLIWVAVALTVVSTLIGFLQLDDAVDAALEADTAGTLTEDTARAGVITFLVAFLILGVAIYAVLALFIKKGKNWARIVFTVLAVIFLVFGVLGLGGDQSAVSFGLGLVQILLSASTLFFLFKAESSAWFKAA